MRIISSKDNPIIKHISKLKEKKYRNEYNEFIIEGVKILNEAIDENVCIKTIIISEDAKESNLIDKYLKEKLEKIDYIQVPSNIFKQITDVENSQGILAVIEKEKNHMEIDYSREIILALENIQDPGNLGTIIRTADSIGLKQIIVSKGTVDAYSSKVIRSTMGAIFRVKIIECEDFIETLKKAKEKKYKIVSTSLSAKKTIYELNFKNSLIIIGNEANGVTKSILNIADEKAIIPMIGKTESLNVAVATGIILYEYIRQVQFE